MPRSQPTGLTRVIGRLPQGRDGAIYGIPTNSDCVLKIVPGDPGEVSTFGKLPKARNKWQGGFLGKDGAIYCIPETADAVLKILPETEQVELIPASEIPHAP
eukprot:5577077-Pyramimonas_sp.AAC.3